MWAGLDRGRMGWAVIWARHGLGQGKPGVEWTGLGGAGRVGWTGTHTHTHTRSLLLGLSQYTTSRDNHRSHRLATYLVSSPSSEGGITPDRWGGT